MLETLRNASKGWMAGILIFLLVASFGLWGVQDWLNLTTNPTIAKVGDVEITPDQFSREFNRFLQQMERQSGVQLGSAEAKKLNLDREALDRMLTRFAILEKARDVGLDIPQAQLVDIIRSIPGMSDGQGGINQNALQQLMTQAQLNNQAEFMVLVRGDVLRQQLGEALVQGVSGLGEVDWCDHGWPPRAGCPRRGNRDENGCPRTVRRHQRGGRQLDDATQRVKTPPMAWAWLLVGSLCAPRAPSKAKPAASGIVTLEAVFL